jgi:cell division protein FtsB
MSSRLLAERVLPIAILVLAIVAVPVMILSPTGLRRLDELRRDKVQSQQEISRLSEQIRQLRAQVEHIKGDPAAVERVARDELGLVRRTELVFQFKN